MKKIVLLLAIKQDQMRERFKQLLLDSLPRMNSKGLLVSVEVINLNDVTSEQSGFAQLIYEFVGKHRTDFTVLLADWLTDPIRRRPTSAASACIASCQPDKIATIGIMSNPGRTPDIDRTIAPNCDAMVLEIAIERVIKRLEYVSAPEKKTGIDLSLLDVRILKNTQTEFDKYFSLRQQIYTIMGYLDGRVESARSQFEITEADTHAIHCGAFYRNDVKDVLAGTARIVLNTEADDGLRKMFLAMISRDVVLQSLLKNPYPLGLPIFQSHKGMNRIMQEILKKDLICGELSRVIVPNEFRGLGISRKLIDFAVQKAIAKGVRRVFLECLEIHEALYQHHGFRRIPGISGPVVDVGRTMIAMEMEQDRIEKIRASSRIQMPAPRISKQSLRLNI